MIKTFWGMFGLEMWRYVPAMRMVTMIMVMLMVVMITGTKIMMMMMIKVGQAYKRGSHIRPTASDKVTRSIFLTSISKLMRMSVILLTM